MADIAPNRTIYCQNLFEKIRSKDRMKKCLYAIFSQFGRILDVIVMGSQRLRGQAWIVFEEQNSATAALRAMQGFPFFDKPMRLSYAKETSDAIAKLEPDYKPMTKEERQAKRQQAKEQFLNRANAKAANPAATNGFAQGPIGADNIPANKILFVENLPEQATSEMLRLLFSQFTGFKEARLVEARPGIAFIEYDNDSQATAALGGLQGFTVTEGHKMRITYAKQ